MKKLPSLIVIADLDFLGSERKWVRVIREITAEERNGELAIQLRMKNPPNDQIDRLSQVAREVAANKTPLILNATLEQAQELNFENVHLSAENLAKSKLPVHSFKFVSAAVHDEEELKIAEEAAVNAVIYSPVFEPNWKDANPQGLGRLGQIVSNSLVPVYALGGVTPQNTQQCIDQGCAGVVVLSGVLSSSDPSRKINDYLQKFNDAKA